MNSARSDSRSTDTVLAMSRAPFAISALVAAAGIAWTVHLAVAPEPFTGSAAVAVSAGIVIFTVIAVVGLLLVRAPWARWLAYATVGTGLAVGVVTGYDDVTAIVAFAFSLAAVGGLSGPWLRVWLRRRPAATAPEPQATFLPLATLALVPITGFVSPDSLSAALVVLDVAAVVLAAGYARAGMWALWSLRIGLPLLTLWAVIGLSIPGAVALVTAAAVATTLAWTPSARRAIREPSPPLPAPRHRAKPSPAEPG